MIIVNTDYLATKGLLYPCPHASCEEWDSDKNGGHCMCLSPPCKEQKKSENKKARG